MVRTLCAKNIVEDLLFDVFGNYGKRLKSDSESDGVCDRTRKRNVHENCWTDAWETAESTDGNQDIKQIEADISSIESEGGTEETET